MPSRQLLSLSILSKLDSRHLLKSLSKRLLQRPFRSSRLTDTRRSKHPHTPQNTRKQRHMPRMLNRQRHTPSRQRRTVSLLLLLRLMASWRSMPPDTPKPLRHTLVILEPDTRSLPPADSRYTLFDIFHIV
jgi:hypothetical protein